MKALFSAKSGVLACSVFMAPIANQGFAEAPPDPGDGQALPPGTDLAILSQQTRRIDRSYMGGKRVADSLDLDLTVGVVRLMHYAEFFGTGLIWAPQIVLSYGRQETGATGQKNEGIGDITFGASVWTLADMELNRHLAWSMLITAPTGENKNQGFALSNNRWVANFQVGYVHGFNERWTWDVAAETEFYKNQRETDVHREPLIQLHNHLRYNFTPQTWVALSYRHNWGSRETLDGLTLDTSHDNGMAGVSVASMLGKQWHVMGQYWRDVEVRSGPMSEHSLQFRLVYIY